LLADTWTPLAALARITGMRPLYHPRVEEMSVQGVLHALSDATRVQIFMQLLASDCSKSCVEFAHITATPLPKSSLSQHFKVLREAGLIHSERHGVELQNRARCDEYGKKFGPLIKEILSSYDKELKAAGKAKRAKRA
jgi:DNA-binding transcriptional ArsR family regulator